MVRIKNIIGLAAIGLLVGVATGQSIAQPSVQDFNSSQSLRFRDSCANTNSAFVGVSGVYGGQVHQQTRGN
ncbi:MAG: hypothetical protein IM613_18730 [Cytophagales bacterium]|nr:hypothetical protein [Cytophagales bacterium]